MFRVEIESTAGWLDHNKSKINKLVFTKEYHSIYIPGTYPLESLGSLYRNIDNFRESPFQARTDWEITLPSVYSSADGAFKTVDLLYWLESVNEENGKQFDLIGCEATLFDGDEVIYNGRVESVTSGGQTSSLRISDWLGTPKIGQSLFPVSVGAADEVSRWPVVLTREQTFVYLTISERPLKSKPTFWLKVSSENYLQLSAHFYTSAGFPLGIKYLGNGYMNARTALPEGKEVYWLAEDIGIENLWIADEHADNILAPNQGKRETADYYTLGEGDDMEIVEAWSNRVWYIGDKLYYSVGRPIMSKRHAHEKGTPFRKMPDAFELFGLARVSAAAESMLLDTGDKDPDPPYQHGNPQYLYWRSQKKLKGGDDANESFADMLFSMSPHIRVYRQNGKTVISPSFSVMINLSCPDAPSGAQLNSATSHTIYLALRYKSFSNEKWYFRYKPKLKVGGVEIASLPEEMNGEVTEFNFTLKKGIDLATALKVELRFGVEYDATWSSVTESQVSEYLENVHDIRILYLRAEYWLLSKIDDNNLYASGTFENSSSEPEEGSDEGTSSVKSSITSLLGMAGVSDCPVNGDTNDLSYGAVINRESFALRDKLRSLAAESATLVRFSQNKKEIIATDISLREDPEQIYIPLDAFLHEGIYSFKMESPDRSDLISGVTINWGKDFETKKYGHVFSITSENGITFDGEKPDELYINEDKWAKVFERMKANANIGSIKVVDSEWIADWQAAENMAYNLLRWNSAPMRKAQARCIFTELKVIKKPIDIGTFIHFDLPGYPEKFAETLWIITGRHDDLESMITTLELLETRDLPAVLPNRFLLLEDGNNVLLENGKPIKLEDFYG